VNCVICTTRKPRRRCPAVGGDICSVCCGTGRENSIDCPLDCDYLKEAHSHERPTPLDPATLPNMDIDVPESFMQQYEWLLVLVGSALVDGALKTPGITDHEIRTELAGLVTRYRGMAVEGEPSLVAESVAARVLDIRSRLAKMPADEAGVPPMELPDETILSVVVFLQRLEISHNNGRKLSRAFLQFLMQFHVPSLPMDDETPAAVESVEPAAAADIS
jgi:hypothetical protein